jgi:hypothetical protein
MRRLLRAVLAWLRKPGRRPSQAGKQPRVSWKGTPVVEGCPGSPPASQFDTLISTRPGRAGQRPGYTEGSKA